MVTAALGAANGGRGGGRGWRADGSEPLLGALAGGFVSAFFSFGGWWEASKVAGEVRETVETANAAARIPIIAIGNVFRRIGTSMFSGMAGDHWKRNLEGFCADSADFTSTLFANVCATILP